METVDLVVGVRIVKLNAVGGGAAISWQDVLAVSPILRCTGRSLKQLSRKWQNVRSTQNNYFSEEFQVG